MFSPASCQVFSLRRFFCKAGSFPPGSLLYTHTAATARLKDREEWVANCVKGSVHVSELKG